MASAARRYAHLLQLDDALAAALRAQAPVPTRTTPPLTPGHKLLGIVRDELRDHPALGHAAFTRYLLWRAFLARRRPTSGSVLRTLYRLRAYALCRAARTRHAAGQPLPLSAAVWGRHHATSGTGTAPRVPTWALSPTTTTTSRADSPASPPPPDDPTDPPADTGDATAPFVGPEGAYTPLTADELRAAWDLLAQDPQGAWAELEARFGANPQFSAEDVANFFAELDADPFLFIVRYGGTPAEVIHALAQYLGVAEQDVTSAVLDGAPAGVTTGDALDFWATYGDPTALTAEEWQAATGAETTPSEDGSPAPSTRDVLELTGAADLLTFERSLLAANRLLSDVQVLQLLDAYWAQQGIQLGAAGALEDAGVDAGLISSWNIVNPTALDYLRQQTGYRITNIDERTRSLVAETLWEGYRGLDGLQALPLDRLARYLQQQMNTLDTDLAGMSRARAMLIARTETARAVSFGTLAVYSKMGVRRKRWIVNAGACLICLGNAEEGDIPLDQSFNSGVLAPPQHPLCFPAGTVVSGPRAVASTERWYEGDLVELLTVGGHFLACTPNHPILTPHGWVAAGLLKEGDHVVSGTLRERVAATVRPDDYQIPARIEDVAHAIGRTSGVTTREVKTATEDFHGDGLDGEVCIVRTDRLLGDGLNATVAQPDAEQLLSGRDAILPHLIGAGHLEFTLQANGLAASSGMGSLSLSTPLLGSEASSTQEVGIAGRAALDVRLRQAIRDDGATDAERLGDGQLRLTRQIAGDDFLTGDRRVRETCSDTASLTEAQTGAPLSQQPALCQQTPERMVTRVKAECGRIEAFASEVRGDRIVHITRRRLSGHVYNLQTETGWYFAHQTQQSDYTTPINTDTGIIVHNCRCSISASVPDSFDPADWTELPFSGADLDSMLFGTAYGDFPETDWPDLTPNAPNSPAPTVADLGLLDADALPPNLQGILTSDALASLGGLLAGRADTAAADWAASQDIALPETDAQLRQLGTDPTVAGEAGTAAGDDVWGAVDDALGDWEDGLDLGE